MSEMTVGVSALAAAAAGKRVVGIHQTGLKPPPSLRHTMRMIVMTKVTGLWRRR